MRNSIRDAVRIAANTHPLSRLRSFEERLGVIGFTLMLLFAMTHPLWAHDFKVGAIEIHQPFSRATPDGAKVAAGYVTIRNTGTEPDRLLSATSTIAGRTEIHEMAVDDKGVMTMRPVEGIDIPAGGQAELKPGGLHLMFLDLTEGTRQGEPFKGTLTFEKAGTVEVDFAVEAMGSTTGHGGHNGHGSHSGHGD